MRYLWVQNIYRHIVVRIRLERFKSHVPFSCSSTKITNRQKLLSSVMFTNSNLLQ
jgi:hypothetical protein